MPVTSQHQFCVVEHWTTSHFRPLLADRAALGASPSSQALYPLEPGPADFVPNSSSF